MDVFMVWHAGPSEEEFIPWGLYATRDVAQQAYDDMLNHHVRSEVDGEVDWISVKKCSPHLDVIEVSDSPVQGGDPMFRMLRMTWG